MQSLQMGSFKVKRAQENMFGLADFHAAPQLQTQKGLLTHLALYSQASSPLGPDDLATNGLAPKVHPKMDTVRE
jgi:hypothetical protein